MDQFFAWLANNPVASVVVTIALGVITLALFVSLTIFTIAFFQGRSISLRPLSIGPKPSGSEGDAKTSQPADLSSYSLGGNLTNKPSLLFLAKALEDKLNRLYTNSNVPFVVVGSTYLDVVVRPIDTTLLNRGEWSNIDPLHFTLGGSTIYVGRYLWAVSNKTQKTYLYSLIGGDDNLITRTFKDLLKNEEWVLNDPISGTAKSQTGVTLHLVQRNNAFTTMFTHRGVLANLDWAHNQDHIAQVLAEGGVLYISGYLKTNLCNDLENNLQKVSNNSMVCIEHGRLVRDLVNREAVHALQKAFEQNLVDVYFCTYKDLVAFYNLSENEEYPTKPEVIKGVLEALPSVRQLPLITLIRDNYLPGPVKVYTIVQDSVIPIEGKAGQLLITRSVGPANAFNAAFMHRLVYGPRQVSIKDQVVDAANYALDFWHQKSL